MLEKIRSEYILDNYFFELLYLLQNNHAKNKTDQELKNQKDMLERASIAGKVALWEWDIQSGLLEWSATIDSMLGLNHGEFPRTAKAWDEIIHPEDFKKVSRIQKNQLGKGKQINLEYRVRRSNGQYIWVHDIGNCVMDENNNVFKAYGAIRDITEKQTADLLLEENEEKLRLKLNSILSEDIEIKEEEFKNIIDSTEIQLLMNDFYDLTKLGIAIVDLKDNILVATGWMDICTKFHRLNKESCKNCRESDILLTSNLKPGQYNLYKCKNNMWEVATPITIGGRHLGNLFFGQFFFEDEVIDYDIFYKQAEKFGFDRIKYITALEKVPRWSMEKIEKIMNFYIRLAQMIGNLSYSNLMLARSLSNSKHTDIKLKKSYEKLQETLNGTINALASIVETKDPYTAGHQKNVEKLAIAIARELNLGTEKISAISIAALIHDIGKIAVPVSILSKPTMLTDIEFRMVKEHSEIGFNFLKDIEFGLPVAKIIHQHHERLDGSGYPAGLKGDEIMLEAKIISVADIVEAMASHRPYRPAIGLEKALEEITAGSNIIYDYSVVKACIDLFKKMQFSF